ncbi:MAG: hypothetical protein IPL49_19585 [Saprospirales bacterium]|nr:hypothetical protein [Saprospirales bacterium]MBK8493021.1 hypothetical protein [Saprospirales bacterium]
MKQTFTPELLLQFLYKETSLAESLEIAEELEHDLLLLEEYQELQEALKEIPNVHFSPSHKAISRILKYSEETTLEAFQ